MRSLWVFSLVVLLLGPRATSASADERAEVQRLRGTVSALQGRIGRLEGQVRRLEGQVERLEGRLERALDRDEPASEEDVKSAVLKAMYRLAERAGDAGKDAELMRALADLYGKIDRAERDGGASRRARGRAERSRQARTKHVELVRAFADLCAKLDRVERARGDSRPVRGRTQRSRQPQAPDAEEKRPRVMLGVALENDGTVSHVLPGTPAAEAGIEPGDVIRRIDGRAVDDAEAIVRLVARKKPGDRITLGLLRGEEKTDVQAVLAERPDP